jgi:hypothetical protein
MNRFIFIFSFCFSSLIGFSQQADTLEINSLDIILIKQNGQIINKEGVEKFYKAWMNEETDKRYVLAETVQRHSDFFKGFSRNQMQELFGVRDGKMDDGYYKLDPKDDESCWAQLLYDDHGFYWLSMGCP